jgi:hypothetical protein
MYVEDFDAKRENLLLQHRFCYRSRSVGFGMQYNPILFRS